jgi:hypothetical protein
MASRWHRGSGVLLALVVLVRPAAGHGWFPVRTSTYYYPVYTYYLPVTTYTVPLVAEVMLPVCPPAVQTAPAYAQPTPAPPSSPPLRQTVEPPLRQSQRPTVTESHSQVQKVSIPADALCRVGFWNLTGREVLLRVAGQTHRLPANQALTLSLSRRFTWQADQQPQETVEIPAERSDWEIVLR